MPTISVSLVMSGIQYDEFNTTIFRLALDSVVPNVTFSDEFCANLTSSTIGVVNEAAVPLVVSRSSTTYEYVTNLLNRSVNEVLICFERPSKRSLLKRQ